MFVVIIFSLVCVFLFLYLLISVFFSSGKAENEPNDNINEVADPDSQGNPSCTLT